MQSPFDALLARGQRQLLLAMGLPTQRAHAPAGSPAPRALRQREAVATETGTAFRLEATEERLILERDALGVLEHGDIVVHGTVRCKVLRGPLPIEPDGQLEQYVITAEDQR